MILEHARSQQPAFNRWVLRWYAISLYLLLPLVPLYLWMRSRKQPEYRQHWAERFAHYPHSRRAIQSQRIWLHAVSLGETRATASLVHETLRQYPDTHIILTHTTPTGREAGQQLFSEYLQTGRMTQVYVPYDLNPFLNRFFETFAPTQVWLMETEVWPNWIAQCFQRAIPAYLINGRMSEKTFKNTLKWRSLMAPCYQAFTHICAQSTIDAQRYEVIGVEKECISVTGNLKFDVPIPTAQLKQGQAIKQLFGSRPVLMLASSREGEEAQWIQAYNQLRNAHHTQQAYPTERTSVAQWWIVPRHPQRFESVAQMLAQAGLKVRRMSELKGLNFSEQDSAIIKEFQAADCILGDTMGEMYTYYEIADVVLMGGSWLDYGGQNFLEPLQLNKTVLIGPSTYNFEAIAHSALTHQALRQCSDLDEAVRTAEDMATNLMQGMRDGSHQQYVAEFLSTATGATQRTLTRIFS